MKREDPEFMFICELCGDLYQMGRHLYDGKQIARYQLGVCKPCHQGNWDSLFWIRTLSHAPLSYVLLLKF
jgi:hypothetical protein